MPLPCHEGMVPFNAIVPEVAPHQGRRQHESKEEFKTVLAEYDRQVGRLTAELKRLGLDENTIVIFSSDNGAGPDFPGNPRSLGMRGQKGSLYEGGTRMPFIVRWPGKTPPGRVDEKSLFNAVDLFPALCKLAGAALPRNEKLDGEDVSEAFTGNSVVRKAPMFWEFDRRCNAEGSSRVPHYSPNLAVREGKWKLLVNRDGSRVEL